MRNRGITVLAEPQIPKHVQLRFAKISQETYASANIFNGWNNAATHVEKMFIYQLEFYQKLKNEQYDLIMSEQMMYQQMLVNFLEIPNFLHIMNGPAEVDLYQKLREPLSHSTEYNLMRQFHFGMEPEDQVQRRGENFLTQLLQKSWLDWWSRQVFSKHVKEEPFSSGSKINEQIDYIFKTRLQNLTLVLQYEGVNPPSPMTPTVNYIVPKYKQQLQKLDTTMSQELKKFYQTYDKIVLVAFGTIYAPADFQLNEIIEFMKTASSKYNWAFVIVIKDEQLVRVLGKQGLEELQKKFPKILKQTFVPQTTLLNHTHTKVFFTHGGQNSVIESQEYAKPMIVMPTAIYDQYLSCYYIEARQLGACARDNTRQYFIKSLQKIEKNGFYQENLQQMSRVIKESKNDRETLEYWVDYMFEVGVEQFKSTQYHKMTFIQFMEIDIFLVIYLVDFLIVRKVLKTSFQLLKYQTTRLFTQKH
eukprot:403359310